MACRGEAAGSGSSARRDFADGLQGQVGLRERGGHMGQKKEGDGPMGRRRKGWRREFWPKEARGFSLFCYRF